MTRRLRTGLILAFLIVVLVVGVLVGIATGPPESGLR
jgi:hypothetical protein